MRFTLQVFKSLFRYDPETGIITWNCDRNHKIKKGMVAGSLSNNGYIYIKPRGLNMSAHRIAWFLYYGDWPKGVVDHINRDKTDNRIANLRDVTQKVNNQNHPPRKNLFGVPGIYYRKSRKKCYVVMIGVDNKNVFIGSYESLLDAYAARKSAEAKYGFHKNHGVPL